jgi:hypothetical protein
VARSCAPISALLTGVEDRRLRSNCTGNNICYWPLPRPFLVGGSLRSAKAVARNDWTRDLAPSSTAIDHRTASALYRGWLDDASQEHASVSEQPKKWARRRRAGGRRGGARHSKTRSRAARIPRRVGSASGLAAGRPKVTKNTLSAPRNPTVLRETADQSGPDMPLPAALVRKLLTARMAEGKRQ